MTCEAKALSNEAALVEVMSERKCMVIHGVFIFGHHLINEKMLDIFWKILDRERNRDLNAIVISKSGPNDRYGEFLMDAKIFVLSLPYILTKSLEATEQTNPNFAINAAIWTNVIGTFAHELHHNVSYSTDRKHFDANKEQEEELAHDYGTHMSVEVHKCMDAEPPSLGMMPWFGRRVMEYMTQKIADGNETWKHQKEMLDNGLVYHRGPDKFKSLAEFWKVTEPDHNWEGDSAELELKVTDTTSELFKNTVPMIPEDDAMTPEQIEDGIMQNAMSEGVAPEAIDERLGEDADAIFDDDTGILLSGPTQTSTPEPPAQPNQPEMSFKDAGKWLWMRLYNHMFDAGGWANGKFNTANAVIEQPVIIAENPVACQMVGSMVVPIGKLFTDGTVPCYDVELTIKGTKYNMRLLAQNPAKNSDYGKRAAAGEKIAWLINQTTEEWVGLIMNGVYYIKKDGKWVVA